MVGARRVSLVEDDPIMGEALVQRLTLEGHTVDWWHDGGAAILGMAATRPDVVLCDIRLPDVTGEDVFNRTASTLSAPFIFITAHSDIEQAVRLMRQGGADYLTKPFEIGHLVSRINAVARRAPEVPTGALGVSEAMVGVELLLRRVADRRFPVLLTGETGVGKEVCARFLQHASKAASAPFVAVNCAAIPAELLESELFGHERGSFSGAATRHLGHAERAREGILFLDEIGEMPLHLQAKMLRLLGERTFHRVGGEQPVEFAGRVVAATNRDLAAAVRAGTFREDLLYRINVVTVDVPPLRERSADVGWLADRLFEDLNERSETGLLGISRHAKEMAARHPWPGNVRELRNRIERAIALADGEWISARDLFPERATASGGGDADVMTLSQVRDEAERREIERGLRSTKGQVAEAARRLGVSRTTLWEKMRRLGIKDSGTSD
ncbi:sigma-54 dependent transcriptional regulator [Jeongeupella avenae]|uniref:Sigma-54 dependent transcriptional regulator n=1 Tax=Antarcticirhabdus aurantiaca TaxID=2606717 RepID=A0ACD4NXH4_9HYPH|nr:sigma-54 dependent transcriptional regulator [Antarcticirhabdus aurantiaca]WAJ31515.1 sigma-54 dependent transcriptional regulator [Jeongeuplla avenae]